MNVGVGVTGKSTSTAWWLTLFEPVRLSSISMNMNRREIIHSPFVVAERAHDANGIAVDGDMIVVTCVRIVAAVVGIFAHLSLSTSVLIVYLMVFLKRVTAVCAKALLLHRACGSMIVSMVVLFDESQGTRSRGTRDWLAAELLKCA